MKVIFTIIVLIVIEAFFEGLSILLGLNNDDSNSSTTKSSSETRNYYGNNNYYKEHWTEFTEHEKHENSIKNRRHSKEEFEEADSYFDKHGNEHIVDYDGYCEDCDDYHW